MIRSRLPSQTFILESYTTDHYPTLFIHDLKPKRDSSITTISTINYKELDCDFEKLNLSSILSLSDPEHATNTFINNLTDIIKKNTTVKTVSKKHKILKPWITPGLLRCIRNKDQLRRQAKANPTNDIYKLTFNRYRNFYKTLKKIKKTI